MGIPDEASDAFFLEKRKKFLAAAGMLYAPVCTPLSRHLLNDFARLSRGPVQDTAVCPKCHCLFLGDSSRVTIREKPPLSKRIRGLRRKSNSQLTGLERRKLRRWVNRKSKVVIHCKTCKQKMTVPGPSSANGNLHRKEAFSRHPGTLKSSLNTKQIQPHIVHSVRRNKQKSPYLTPATREKDKLDVNPANRGKKERKLKHIKSMLKGSKKKKSEDSKSPLLKFLSSI